jgi:hypothetical protein
MIQPKRTVNRPSKINGHECFSAEQKRGAAARSPVTLAILSLPRILLHPTRDRARAMVAGAPIGPRSGVVAHLLVWGFDFFSHSIRFSCV